MVVVAYYTNEKKQTIDYYNASNNGMKSSHNLSNRENVTQIIAIQTRDPILKAKIKKCNENQEIVYSKCILS